MNFNFLSYAYDNTGAVIAASGCSVNPSLSSACCWRHWGADHRGGGRAALEGGEGGAATV